MTSPRLARYLVVAVSVLSASAMMAGCSKKTVEPGAPNAPKVRDANGRFMPARPEMQQPTGGAGRPAPTPGMATQPGAPAPR